MDNFYQKSRKEERNLLKAKKQAQIPVVKKTHVRDDSTRDVKNEKIIRASLQQNIYAMHVWSEYIISVGPRPEEELYNAFCRRQMDLQLDYHLLLYIYDQA
uniref:Uncharacterized protein n=1 Tax=Romanomermis culicivorax TaxID=13658 RepID=A0A915I7K9_ROMCU